MSGSSKSKALSRQRSIFKGTGYRGRDEMDWKMLWAAWYENEEKGYISAY
jgi:hypothetical protein